MLIAAQSVFSEGSTGDKSDEKSLADVIPIWSAAREVTFQNSDTLLLVPYWFKKDVVQSAHENVYLVFFEDDQGKTDFATVGFESTEDGPVDRSLDDLNGYMFVGRKDFSISHVAMVVNGVPTQVAYDKNRLVWDQLYNTKNPDEKTCEQNLSWFDPFQWLRDLFSRGNVSCPSPFSSRRNRRNTSRNWLGNFFDAIRDTNWTTSTENTGNFSTYQSFWTLFGSVSSSSGGVSAGSGGGLGGGLGGGGLNTNPSGNGEPLNLSNFYEELENAPVVQDIVNLLEDCLTGSEDQLSALHLIQNAYLECVDHFGNIGNPNYLVQQYLCTSVSVLDRLENNSMGSACASNALKARTIQLLFGDNYSRFVQLRDDPQTTTMIWDFLQDNDLEDSAEEYVTLFFELYDDDDDYKWERFEELWNLVEGDPDALIRNCPPEIEDWQSLASFVPSGSVLDRINNTSNYEWQSIQDAKARLVNLDYYSTNIEQMPNMNGQEMSAQELFDHFRININNFAPKFTPHSAFDMQLWNSRNPLTTIMEISMAVEPFTGLDLADGDVICSQYEPCCWIFTTLYNSATLGGNGFHPVSGNRKFGYRILDGQFVLYTQGADRATKWWHAINGGNNAYDAGDQLWSQMIEEFIDFVNKNGGYANTNIPSLPITFRPDWSAVKDMLTSSTRITSIPCN
jgi:hypothetical protein